MITRHLRRSLCLLALMGATSLTAQDLTLTPISIGWRDASSFKRISEYFTGRENTGDTTVLRTHPDQRSGYYFFVRTETPAPHTAAHIVLHLVMPADQQPHTHTFKMDLGAGKNLLNLGLTGADWPDGKTNPVAWKIEITTADGRLLASEKSYLWDKPVGK